MRPTLFIGSSSEGLIIAKALQALLDQLCNVATWSQGTFRLSLGPLESLVAAVDQFDFAVLVLTPDDLVTSRAESSSMPRDNVLFELGFFMGSLGRGRTFMLYDRTAKIKVPSDLSGIIAATFEPRESGNLEAALGKAAREIGLEIDRLGPRNPSKAKRMVLDEFSAFFGEAATKGPYRAYFASAQIDGKWKYPHPEARVAQAQPKGMGHAIPYEEVAPIAELDRLFRDFGKGVQICLDECIDGQDLPKTGCLSIGLGFNNMTSALSDYSNKFFEIKYVPVESRDRMLLHVKKGAPSPRSDDFVINHEKRLICPSEMLESSQDEDYALIARILHDDRPYIICAGRTAHGTAAALKYLSSHWATCYRAFIEGGHDLRTENMVAVLTHAHGRREPQNLKSPFFAPSRRSS